MIDLKKDIKLIVCSSSINSDSDFAEYRVDFEGEDSIIIPPIGKERNSDEIISESEIFVNGYKVVQLVSGEFAYVSERTGDLLPLRFDLATNFNKYGFAMIAKDGKVSWMNSNFEYIDYNGKWIMDYEHFRYNALNCIYNFSKGDIPLSIVAGDDPQGKTSGIESYMGIDGKLKEFSRININDGSLYDHKFYFSYARPFDETGFAFPANGHYLISDEGYYFTFEDIIQMHRKNNFLSCLNEQANKIIDSTHHLVKKD